VGKKLTAVSLFAGVGGFDLALQNNGVEVTAAVEIDKKAREVLAKHFPNTKLFNDVQEVTGEQLKATGFISERGILTGGFPCQDLSIAGLRRGLAGKRSGLFHEIIRLTDELKPQFIILENVAGLLSSQRGKDMGIVITALVERGYGVCWRVLDSQNFGVAQRRKRIFIVASLGNHRQPVKILFEPESGFRDTESLGKKRQTITKTIENGSRVFVKAKRAQTVNDDESWVAKETVPTLNAFDIGDTRTTTAIIERARAFNMRSDDKANNMTVYETNQTGSVTALQPSPLTHRSQTLITQENTIVRRLTPKECERLQGFPDDWTAGQADSNRYKQMGNAVTVNVVDWIIKRLVDVVE
jgi:DNA (cytosine-5)-methyltransferase 1